jgi:hypothetical protein
MSSAIGVQPPRVEASLTLSLTVASLLALAVVLPGALRARRAVPS